MIGTVDLVIAGDCGAARAAAIAALQRGCRVLVVLRCGGARRRLRRWLCRAAGGEATRVTVMVGADVVCADGVGGVEAVVIRYRRTGRLFAVNTSAFLQCAAR